MKHKIIPILTFILGAIIFGGIGVYAAKEVLATQIKYNNTTVDAALNDLYTRASNCSGSSENKICKKLSGDGITPGTAYSCDPGDGVYRTFYLLKVNDDTVDLLLDRNIGESYVTYSQALTYFTTGEGKKLTNKWTNVSTISIPKAQDIADATNIPDWDVTTAEDISVYYGGSQEERSNYAWAYNFLKTCPDYGCNTSIQLTTTLGYWTVDKLAVNSNRVWRAGYKGYLASVATNNSETGVRPVITISASQI